MYIKIITIRTKFMTYKDNRAKLNKIANTWGSTGNMEMDFMRNKIDEISNRPEEIAKGEALKEHFSDPRTYRDWLHDSNAWFGRTLAKVPGAIPNAVGGIYDLGTGLLDLGINGATYSFNKLKGTPNKWQWKDYTRPDDKNNWGYNIGNWLNKYVGQPINSVNLPGRMLDYATTAPDKRDDWRYWGMPEYSDALQKADTFNVMGLLEDAAAEAGIGAAVSKAINPLNFKQIKGVLADNGLKLKDYKIVDRVSTPKGKPNTYIRANRHVRNPLSYSTNPRPYTGGSFTSGDFLWGSPSSRPALAYRFGGSSPIIPKNNQPFQISSDPWKHGNPLFILDDTNIQKWPNGKPVITKDMPYTKTDKSIKLADHHHQISVNGSGYSQGWPDSRKALAIEQNMVPRNNNTFYNAIDDKTLANEVGLDDDAFNLLEVVRNPSDNTADVVDVFIPPRFAFKHGTPLSDSMLDYLHLVRKGKTSLNAEESLPLTFLNTSNRVQNLTKAAIVGKATNHIPEYLRRKEN
jgi:hypothetical protein